MKKDAMVLVVDGSVEAVAATQRVLTAEGFETLGAASGAECLQLARARLPDVVLLSAALPDISGVDLCKQMQRDPELSGIYVVLLSSQDTPPALLARGLDAGADAYLTRPIPSRELVARIEAMLRRRRVTAELHSLLDELQSTLDALSDALYVVDLQGKIVRCNLALAKLLGKPISEIVGHSCCRVIHGTATPIDACLLANARRSHRRESLLVPLRERWLQVIVDPLLNESGQVVGGVHVMSDVTERKQAEEALQQERHLLSEIVNESGTWVVVLDAQGHIERFNRTCEQATGYAQNDVQGKLLWDALVPPEEVPPIQSAFSQLLEGRFASESENTWVMKDGSRRRVSWSLSTVLDAKGAVERVIASGIDVTAARYAEAKLRGERDLASSIIDKSGGLLLLLDATGRIVRANPASERLCGYTQEELRGKHVWECCLSSRDAQDMVSALVHLSTASAEATLENTWLCKDGSQHQIAWRNSVIRNASGAPEYIVCSGTDITARQHALDATRCLIDAFPNEAVLLDANGGIVALNAAATQAFGRTPAELIGCSLYDLLPPAAADQRRNEVEAALRTGELARVLNERDGRTWETTLRPIAANGERPTWLVLLATDVTERLHAEEAMRQQRDLATAIVSNADALVMLLDAQGRIVLFNRCCEDVTGYSLAEAQGKPAWELLCSPERATALQSLLSGLSVDQPDLTHEDILLRKDGSARRIAWNERAIAGAQGQAQYVVATGVDLTALRDQEKEWQRAQEELGRVQQGEAVRQVSQRMASEFNDLATVIMGNAEVGLATVDALHPLQPKLALMHQAAKRAAALTGELLAQGQPPELPLETVDVRALMEGLAHTLRGLLEPIEMRLELPAQSASAQGNADALRQALLGLALETRQNMADAGVCTLRAVQETLDETQEPTHAGTYVRLSMDVQGEQTSEAQADDAPQSAAWSLLTWTVQRQQGWQRVERHAGGWQVDVFLPIAG